MDPGLFEELDELSVGGASRGRGLDVQEQEWEEFVRRRDEEARRKQEEKEAKLREKEAEDGGEQAEQPKDWQTNRYMLKKILAPELRLHPPDVATSPDCQADRERARGELSLRQQERSARRHPPADATKPQQQRPNLPADDPFGDFCKKVRTANLADRENDKRMAALREKRDAAEVSSDEENASGPEDAKHYREVPECGEMGREVEGRLPTMKELLKSIGTDERKELPRALRRLLVEIDQADKEDREFEALKPLLPDLEHAGQRRDDVLANPADDSNPLLKMAVRYLQEQRPDINFQELYLTHAEAVLRAGALVESEEGTMAATEHAQRELLLEERAWMEERRELRRSQWAAAREATEASGRSALAAVPKNTKISCAPAASSSGAWPAGGVAASSYSACSGYAGGGRAASSSAAWLGEAAPPPLLAVPPGRRGAAAQGNGRLAAARPGQFADSGASRRFAPPRRQAQEELTPARKQQLEQARQQDEQARLQSFREAWRRRRGAPPDAEVSQEAAELD